MWPFKNETVYKSSEELRRANLERGNATQTCVKCGHLVAADRTVTVTHKYSYKTEPGKEYFCEEHVPPYRMVTHSAYGSHVAYTRDRVERTHYCADGTPLWHKEYLS